MGKVSHSIDIAAILEGYAQGYFLMADEETGSLDWYGTERHTVIPLDERFHCPRSLRPLVRSERFQVQINAAFDQVVEGCAARPQTWISPQLKQIYRALHRAGFAHSFETWQGDTLAGGILGITIGAAFIGESMFYRIPNGSKVAMVKLVQHLRARGFRLFDAQLMNPHLARFGAFEMDGPAYWQLLQQCIGIPCTFA
ncbi:leucyl/phenylalanyl-tRNA--protein transferase [Synechococcus bigranulatus str. 'Rupite']|uniref:Leucyl/phenylalanyl-tRNA--protein transferase n=1 Tax=Thermostichus vulcanus str. 'Rupite' TaxID=2813851 RepID=A0ABT0C770_THEVL|nr:leucyl/phenylalanyl-tRNA--protein transferase [Thermostichus vulcanus]MCJ2541637.1 leucyl/phenylalanyl-tRNA--protein transferase [Thermostichus vulcanus str. 'Rupite']